MKVAFFVNPIAGSGLLYNLKDSAGVRLESLEKSYSVRRAENFVLSLNTRNFRLLVPAGIMGEQVISGKGFNSEVVFTPRRVTDSSDTIGFLHSALELDPDIIVFCGGDGTAADVVSVVDMKVPVIGIPAGLKMYSSVFALDERHAASLLDSFLGGSGFSIREGEVADLDKGYFQTGIFQVNSFGEMLTVVDAFSPVESKSEYPGDDTEGAINYFMSTMDANRSYFIGPGSTCKKITERLGAHTDRLGFDIVKGGRIIVQDATESELYLHSGKETTLVLSPVGGLGFLLGRGNRQISARILEKIGFENILVIAGEKKLDSLASLAVDTDREVKIPEFIRVLHGYGFFRLVPLVRFQK